MSLDPVPSPAPREALCERTPTTRDDRVCLTTPHHAPITIRSGDLPEPVRVLTPLHSVPVFPRGRQRHFRCRPCPFGSVLPTWLSPGEEAG